MLGNFTLGDNISFKNASSTTQRLDMRMKTRTRLARNMADCKKAKKNTKIQWRQTQELRSTKSTRERGVDKDRADVEYLRWWFGRKMVTLQKTSSQPGFSPRGNSHEYEKHRLSCKAFTLRSRFYSQLFRLPHTLFSITIINGHLHFQQYPFSASELLL